VEYLMPFELEKQSHGQHGFAVVRRFLDDLEFAELKLNLDRYISDVVPKLSYERGYRSHWKSKILGFSQGTIDCGTDANCSSPRQRRSFPVVFKGVSCQRDEAACARYLSSAREQHQEMGLRA
jgi:hypothetical protein